MEEPPFELEPAAELELPFELAPEAELEPPLELDTVLELLLAFEPDMAVEEEPLDEEAALEGRDLLLLVAELDFADELFEALVPEAELELALELDKAELDPPLELDTALELEPPFELLPPPLEAEAAEDGLDEEDLPEELDDLSAEEGLEDCLLLMTDLLI